MLVNIPRPSGSTEVFTFVSSPMHVPPSNHIFSMRRNCWPRTFSCFAIGQFDNEKLQIFQLKLGDPAAFPVTLVAIINPSESYHFICNRTDGLNSYGVRWFTNGSQLANQSTSVDGATFTLSTIDTAIFTCKDTSSTDEEDLNIANRE